MALPNPSFEPETHRWQPRAVAPSREVPSQICEVLGQKQPFFAENSPLTRVKRPSEGKRWLHATCSLNSPVSKSPLVPFNSTICPRNGPKRRQKAAKSAQRAPTPRNQVQAVSWATWLEIRFRGHLVHPQPPLFVVSNPRNRPNGRLDPRTSGHLVQPEGSPARARRGPTVGPTRSPGRKKRFFPKLFPDHLGCSNRCSLARFEPVVARFGPWKIPKCLENGSFWDQKRVKNGSKKCFSKSDRGPFGMLKQLFLAHFEPICTRFGPWTIPKCLENGPLWEQK